MGNAASDKKNARCYSLKFSRNTDTDILEKLDSVENVQGYLKDLIRKDIKENEEEKTMKLYEGFTQEGRKVEIILEGGHVWTVDVATGDREQYNDEWYSEDDTASLASVKASMISEGYRF